MRIETEDVCPESPTGKHEPDWGTIEETSDDEETYVDVSCRHCGRSGCIGTSKTLEDGICW